MKIRDIKTFLVGLEHRNLVFVKVVTDAGVEGIGEAYSVGPDEATTITIGHLKDWLIGSDPRNIEHLWNVMVQGLRFPGGSVVNAAISGIELALWDVKARALGVPVYELLGGKCRDKVRVYQSVAGPTPEALASHARQLIDRYGYTALKIFPFTADSDRRPWAAQVREAVARLAAVREAVGEDIDIGVDPHAKIFEPARAIQLAQALRPYNPFFLEEPLRPDDIGAMAQVRREAGVPIATGEMLYGKGPFRDLLVQRSADIIQPDICIAGGMVECRKIAAMAEAFSLTVAPHNPIGPVATAINVHFAASISNFLILEYIPDDAPPRRDLVKQPLAVKNGYIAVPTSPGWGVELNEDTFDRYPPKPWHRDLPIRADGSTGFI